MALNTFGLDLGSKHVRAVWLDSTGEHAFSLSSAFSAPMPEKGLQSESPLDQQQVAQVIGQVVSEAHITVKSVNIALPENQVYTRVVETPVLSDKELTSAIYWIAEQQIPIPLKSVTLDYRILHKPTPEEKSTTMQVLLVGAPTALLDRYEHVLSLIGLSIASVETDTLAALRVLTKPDKIGRMVLNVGLASSTLSLAVGNDLRVVYSIPTGTMALTRAISTNLNMSLTQAEAYKNTYGVTPGHGNSLEVAVEPILNVMVSEVKKAISFFREKLPDATLSEMLLIGDDAQVPGLAQYFQARTGLTTHGADPWGMLGIKNLPKELVDEGPAYAVALGLAMRTYE